MDQKRPKAMGTEEHPQTMYLKNMDQKRPKEMRSEEHPQTIVSKEYGSETSKSNGIRGTTPSNNWIRNILEQLHQKYYVTIASETTS